LTDIAKKVLNEEKIALEDYLSGKEKALDYIIGKCMALSKSKADPIKINKILLTLIRTR
jgi:aspartyl-tRNA(Asn)/glutamyl-tRNA(Gln) amidotransferase subunit B